MNCIFSGSFVIIYDTNVINMWFVRISDFHSSLWEKCVCPVYFSFVCAIFLSFFICFVWHPCKSDVKNWTMALSFCIYPSVSMRVAMMHRLVQKSSQILTAFYGKKSSHICTRWSTWKDASLFSEIDLRESFWDFAISRDFQGMNFVYNFDLIWKLCESCISASFKYMPTFTQIVMWEHF